MAKPKLKRIADRLIISFWDEGPKQEAGSEPEAGIIEFVLVLIIIWFIDKNTITLDPAKKSIIYQKKKILRKARTNVYSFSKIKSLQMVQHKRKGHLKAETTEGESLLFSPNIKKRRLAKVSKAVADLLNIEPQIVETNKGK